MPNNEHKKWFEDKDIDFKMANRTGRNFSHIFSPSNYKNKYFFFLLQLVISAYFSNHHPISKR
ncbi:hypothetical protein KKHLCK_03245 [Candidatus Electrothrix laxa]